MISVPMKSHCISPSRLPGTSRLFRTFAEDFGAVAEFYSHAPTLEGVARSAREVRLDAAVRRAVVERLQEHNRRFGADDATQLNLDRLAAGAVAVVTGQQVGLFTGPSYSIYKAAGAIALAQQLTARGVDAVPVFWLAAEDHDLAEVNQCHLLDDRQQVHSLQLEFASAPASRSVGEIGLPPSVAALSAQASKVLAGPCSPDVRAALTAAYAPGETFSSAFARLILRIFAGRGLILLDPMDAELHRLAADIYRRAVEGNSDITASLLARTRLLEGAGFHAQVKVTESSTNLFLRVDGERRPLRRRNSEFVAGSTAFSRSELLALAEREPHRFSANVLLRPVLQDALLPTAAYLGGAAEVAYFAQAHVIYERLLGRMPAVLARPGFTLVEAPAQRLLRKYKLDAETFFAGRAKLRAAMEAACLPRPLARHLERSDKSVRAALEKLREPIGALDSTLLGAMDNAEKKMLYQLGKLRARAARAEAFRRGVVDRHEQLLLNSLLPHHALQERSLCFLAFLARHGTPLLDQIIFRAVEQPAPGSHHILFL
jgi:bacillithiol biosynthesis cysteine-adding enzyme BshC